jgi:hypothetical protein
MILCGKYAAEETLVSLMKIYETFVSCGEVMLWSDALFFCRNQIRPIFTHKLDCVLDVILAFVHNTLAANDSSITHVVSCKLSKASILPSVSCW